MESSLHSDGMINIKPPRLSPVTNTSLFTLLLQSGFSTVMLPLCLCKSSMLLSVPTCCCCCLSDPLSQLYFSLLSPSPFSLFLSHPISPCLLPGEELGVVPPNESHVSGEQRGRQRAEWDALSAGETGQHCHSGGSALQPAGWAQGTGRVPLQAIFHAVVVKAWVWALW